MPVLGQHRRLLLDRDPDDGRTRPHEINERMQTEAWSWLRRWM